MNPADGMRQRGEQTAAGIAAGAGREMYGDDRGREQWVPIGLIGSRRRSVIGRLGRVRDAFAEVVGLLGGYPARTRASVRPLAVPDFCTTTRSSRPSPFQSATENA
jgi:hypothetical protein